MLSTLKITNKIFAFYLFFIIVFSLIGFNKQPPIHNILLQIYFCTFGYLLCVVNLKKSINYITFSIFIYQLISIGITTWVNFVNYGDILGYNPIDPAFYRDCGELYGDKNYSIFFIWLSSTFSTIDDWGFPSIVWLVYKLFAGNAQFVLRVLNALLIALGSKYLYKLSLSFIDERYSKLLALCWGIMPFATTVGAGGAKENIFCFIVILFFYFLYQYYKVPSMRNFLMIIFFAFGTLLFRLSCGYSTVLCFISVLLIKNKFVNKHFRFIVWVICFVSIIIFPYVLSILIDQRGLDQDVFSAGNEVKADSVGGFVGYAINAISSFIGPIPCFISGDFDKLQFLTRYSFSPFFKIVTSYFFFYAVYITFREKKMIVIPILVFVFVNILMLVVAFFGLQVKFQWPHFPVFFLVSIWGYIEYIKRGTSNYFYSLYLFFVMILIVLYNIK